MTQPKIPKNSQTQMSKPKKPKPIKIKSSDYHPARNESLPSDKNFFTKCYRMLKRFYRRPFSTIILLIKSSFNNIYYYSIIFICFIFDKICYNITESNIENSNEEVVENSQQILEICDEGVVDEDEKEGANYKIEEDNLLLEKEVVENSQQISEICHEVVDEKMEEEGANYKVEEDNHLLEKEGITKKEIQLMMDGIPLKDMPDLLRLRVIGVTISHILLDEMKAVGFITTDVIEELFQEYTGVPLEDACKSIGVTFSQFVDKYLSGYFKNCMPHGVVKVSVVDQPLPCFNDFAPVGAITAQPSLPAIEGAPSSDPLHDSSSKPKPKVRIMDDPSVLPSDEVKLCVAVKSKEADVQPDSSSKPKPKVRIMDDPSVLPSDEVKPCVAVKSKEAEVQPVSSSKTKPNVRIMDDPSVLPNDEVKPCVAVKSKEADVQPDSSSKPKSKVRIMDDPSVLPNDEVKPSVAVKSKEADVQPDSSSKPKPKVRIMDDPSVLQSDEENAAPKIPHSEALYKFSLSQSDESDQEVSGGRSELTSEDDDTDPEYFEEETDNMSSSDPSHDSCLSISEDEYINKNAAVKSKEPDVQPVSSSKTKPEVRIMDDPSVLQSDEENAAPKILKSETVRSITTYNLLDDKYVRIGPENKQSKKSTHPQPPKKATKNDFIGKFDPSIPIVGIEYLDQISYPEDIVSIKGSNPLTKIPDVDEVIGNVNRGSSSKKADVIPVMGDDELFGSLNLGSSSKKTDVIPVMGDDEVIGNVNRGSSSKKADVIPVMDDDELLGSLNLGSSSKKADVIPVMGDDELFGSLNLGSLLKKVPVPIMEDDELFGSLNLGSSSKKVPVPIMEDDELFGSLNLGSSSKKVPVPIMEDDELFGSLNLGSSSKKVPVPIMEEDELFGSLNLGSSLKKSHIPIVGDDFLDEVCASDIVTVKAKPSSTTHLQPSKTSNRMAPASQKSKTVSGQQPVISHYPSNNTSFQDEAFKKMLENAEISPIGDSDSDDSEGIPITSFTLLEYKIDRQFNVPNYQIVSKMKAEIAKTMPKPQINHLINFWATNFPGFAEFILFFQYFEYHNDRINTLNSFYIKSYLPLVNAIVKREPVFQAIHQLLVDIPLMTRFKFLIFDDNTPGILYVNPRLLEIQVFPLACGLPSSVMHLFKNKKKWIISDMQKEFSDCDSHEFYRQLGNFLTDRPDLALLECRIPKGMPFPQMTIALNPRVSLQLCCFLYQINDLHVAEKLHLRDDYIDSMKQFKPPRSPAAVGHY